MAASVESIIIKLLQNSSNEGQAEGFQEIKARFKDPVVVIELCNCITQSQDPNVRRYAAVLLRRRVVKAKQWKILPQEVKDLLKANILEAYCKPNEKIVRNGIAELIGAIAKHELANERWPALFGLLHQSINSDNTADKEIGLYSLDVISRALGAKLKPHYKTLLTMFQSTLTDTSSIDIPFQTMRILMSMIYTLGSEEAHLYHTLMPSVFQVIKLIASADQEKATECLEIFDEMIEADIPLLVPHYKTSLEFCLQIAQTDSFEEDLRVKAINTVASLIRAKKKAVIKMHMIQPIVGVLFPLMCQPCPGDADVMDDDDDEQHVTSAAGQALDVMAVHLPPAKLIPLLLQHMNVAFKSPDPNHRKAAYLALAVIAEGASEYIRAKHLASFVPILITGIKDPEHVVRNAALFAIGQYAEFLQPCISNYANELLPVLFEHLQQTGILLQQGNKNPPSLVRSFYALERFCENLENIEIYLTALMDCLTMFLSMDSENSIQVKELALEAIGSVAVAAKAHFVPYFQTLMEQLLQFIRENVTEEKRNLHMQCLDTFSILIRVVGPEISGKETFARECIIYAMNLVQSDDDPDIRKVCYVLFSSVSVVLKEDMAPYLQPIIEKMLEAVKSNEGINISTKSDGDHSFALFEDSDEEEVQNNSVQNGGMADDDDDDEDDDADDITGLSVVNSYVEEKEGALIALKELCEEVGNMFHPYLDVCFNEVKKLLSHLCCDVRKEAVSALGQFCVTLNDICVKTGNLECRISLEQYLNHLMPKIFTLAREETEHLVVMSCLETLQQIIDSIKTTAITQPNLESVCLLIKDVFKNKLACQDEDEETDEGGDDQEGEYDTMVMECAGDLIVSLTKVIPWTQFVPYFAGLLNFLVAKSKKACTTAEKSFAIGTVADVVGSMEQGTVEPFINHLQPVFLGGMKDESEEVRSNAVYGLGELIANAEARVFDHYPMYLQALSNMMSTEEDARAKDNIMGAAARMIMTNADLVPLDEIFPIMFKSLPLQGDTSENETCFKCILVLYGRRYEKLLSSTPEVLKLSSDTLLMKKTNDKTREVVSVLLKSIFSEYAANIDEMLKTLPPQNVEAIGKLINENQQN